MKKMYFCIDLKTFFASVECVERKLDPFKTNLVVADESRGKGGICLAITPKMKNMGIKNRCRLYEIPPNVKYIIAKPRMKKYIEYSANVYSIYLKYFSKDDIYVYSIDEVFIDVSAYLKLYKKDPIDLVKFILDDIYKTYGLTATCGIGTNLYLAKVAMDIISKHNPSNIGYLDEELYKEKLWHHRPLTDFWQIGKGIEKRLNKMHIYDMYDVSKANKKRLFKEFGVNVKHLIDHSNGIETCTIKDIKEYKPQSKSISTSQILFKDYTYDDAMLAMKEMVEVLTLKLVEQDLKTSTISLFIGYSNDLIMPSKKSKKLFNSTDSYSALIDEFVSLYKNIVNKNEKIRKIGIAFENLESNKYEQIDLFTDMEKTKKEEKIEKTINLIKLKMGKNSILKGMNLEENATTIKRNNLIGGHNAE